MVGHDVHAIHAHKHDQRREREALLCLPYTTLCIQYKKKEFSRSQLYVKCDITCQIVESKSNHPDRESLEDEAWRTDE